MILRPLAARPWSSVFFRPSRPGTPVEHHSCQGNILLQLFVIIDFYYLFPGRLTEHVRLFHNFSKMDLENYQTPAGKTLPPVELVLPEEARNMVDFTY
jgi:hypothetical protein